MTLLQMSGGRFVSTEHTGGCGICHVTTHVINKNCNCVCV